MKKLKANAILTTFVFGFTLSVLSSFGIDAAYVILSRYKLQKVTEIVASEYAANFGANLDNNQEIKEQYETLYNILGSGVLAFEIGNMEYKTNIETNETVVKVTTTSRVLPMFLRMVGVSQIILHSVVCAKTNQIEITKTISADDLTYNTEFSAPFEENDNIAELITAKNIGNGDFSINFALDSSGGLESGGGFFIFAGNGSEWVDIGDKILEGAESSLTNVASNSFYCVNASSGGSVVFDLAKESQTEGETKRLSSIKIYKALGSATLQPDGSYLDPCDEDNFDSEYFNRDANITLKILNNVNLITTSEYNSFVSKENED